MVFLDKKDLIWITTRSLDPTGKVFYRDCCYYRAIHPAQVDYVKSLFDDGIIQELIDSNLTLPVELTDIEVEGFGLVLKTKETTWNIPVFKYPLSLFYDAANCWLEIDAKLSRKNLSLVDGHYWNFIVSENNTPKWIDLGSIQPCVYCNSGLLEFFDYFLHPLLILKSKERLSDILRIVMKERGIKYGEYISMMGIHIYAIPLTALYLLTRASSRICRLTGLQPIILRRFIVQSLTLFVKLLKPKPRRDFWANYGENFAKLIRNNPEMLAVDPRNQQIVDLVKQAKPSSVIDAGANSGHFSLMVAPFTNAVLAFDTSEFAIEKFVLYLKSLTTSNITACVDNFHQNDQSADLVMALAITHHIVLGQHFKFDYVAKKLSDMTNNALITEFMPNGLGTQERALPDPMPAYYKLDIFLDELRHFFTDVRVVNYTRPEHLSPRTLIYCSGKKHA